METNRTETRFAIVRLICKLVIIWKNKMFRSSFFFVLGLRKGSFNTPSKVFERPLKGVLKGLENAFKKLFKGL